MKQLEDLNIQFGISSRQTNLISSSQVGSATNQTESADFNFGQSNNNVIVNREFHMPAKTRRILTNRTNQHLTEEDNQSLNAPNELNTATHNSMQIKLPKNRTECS